MKHINEFEDLKKYAIKLGVNLFDENNNFQVLWDTRIFILDKYKIWITIESEKNFNENDFNSITVTIRNGEYRLTEETQNIGIGSIPVYEAIVPDDTFKMSPMIIYHNSIDAHMHAYNLFITKYLLNGKY